MTIKVIGFVMALIVKTLETDTSKELVKEFVVHIRDWLRAKVLGTASKVDDTVVLPLLAILEKAADLPPAIDE